MHESFLVNSILENIENQDDVIEVYLEVGELARIEAEHLKEHLQERKKKWKIHVKPVESTVECKCGFKGRAKIDERLHDLVMFSCPNCGDFPKVLEGKDIKIVKVLYK